MGRLLIAERNPTLRTMLAAATRQAAHDVTTVDCGDAAFHQVNTTEYDCLVIGAPLVLNSHDSRSLMQYIEERGLELSARIVVLTTRTSDAALLARAARLRVCAVVSAPFDLPELLQTIQACSRAERPPQRFVGFSEQLLNELLDDGSAATEW